jgi:hypothetical protein
LKGVERLAPTMLNIDDVDIKLAYGYPNGTAAEGIRLLINLPEVIEKNAPVCLLEHGYIGMG